MNSILQKHSRRNVLQTGLAATVAALSSSNLHSQQSPRLSTWEPKKPGEISITALCENDPTLETGLRPIMTRVKNARFWWAGNYRPITPDMINDTDLLITYYSGFIYTDKNVAAIIDGITNRGMGWLAIHNTCWFAGDKLNSLMGAYSMLHREIQPVIIHNLNQDHPITQGIEPFVIQLDEQFGVYMADPRDPDVTLLFRSHGVHDDHRTIQGWCAQRGKGRIVGMTPGHYSWTWSEPPYSEMLWRAAHWALNLPIKPFYGSYENFIW
ncbi:MAG: ThuA domain-containing protein [Candidatus Latescibacter sp.]|nr:ThuA domain-containing protein [Candidatus Latescibacter sp.]